jgi:histidine ammonia-lyase
MSLSVSFETGSANARLTSNDVVKVAVSYQPVEIDAEGAAVASKKIGDMPLDGQWPEVQFKISEHHIARAGLFCRLYSLGQNKAVAAANDFFLVKRIATLLNSNIIPMFSDAVSAGEVLLAALNGDGNCLVPRSATTAISIPIAKALELCELSPSKLPTFSKEETNAVVDYPFISIGAASLLAAAASNINSVVDCISALSCEAFGGSGLIDSFDSVYHELSRPHR